MAYGLKDMKQSAIGAFTGVIFLLALRGDSPFFFNPTKGLIITGILLWIYYNGFRMKDKMQHFIMNIIVVFVIAAFIAHTFNLITYEQIISYEVFGSLVIIATWIGIVQAMLFDRFNFTSPLNRFYVRGR